MVVLGVEVADVVDGLSTPRRNDPTLRVLESFDMIDAWKRQREESIREPEPEPPRTVRRSSVKAIDWKSKWQEAMSASKEVSPANEQAHQPVQELARLSLIHI